MWSILAGHSTFTLLITGSGSLAEASIAWLIHELSENRLLREDFPEACLPFHLQDGCRHRRMVYDNSNVTPEVGPRRLRLAAIQGHRSAAVFRACSVTESFAGLAESLPQVTRPTLILGDDPAGSVPRSEAANRRIERALLLVPQISGAGSVTARVA